MRKQTFFSKSPRNHYRNGATNTLFCSNRKQAAGSRSASCPSAHYLKRSLAFICRACDVAPSSTFPSRADYIRAPVWLYKTGVWKKEGQRRRETQTEKGDGSHDETAFACTVALSWQASVNVFHCENRVIFGFICMGFGNIGSRLQIVKIRLLWWSLERLSL